MKFNMDEKREGDICIFLFAEMWKTSPVQRYRKESATCRNEAQFAAQPHSKPSECTNVHNLVWRKKLISYFDVPFDSVCYTEWIIRKWKKQTDIYHIQSLIYKRNLTHTELLLATLFLNVIIRYVVILIIIITFHLLKQWTICIICDSSFLIDTRRYNSKNLKCSF